MDSINVQWEHHTSHQSHSFLDFLHQNYYTDCMLSAEGRIIYAHKIVLAVASPVFMELFQLTQFVPSIVHMVNGVKYQDFRNVIEFIYSGIIHIKKHQVKNFLSLCKIFKVKGTEELESAFSIQKLSSLKKPPKRLINKVYSSKKKLSSRNHGNFKINKNCFKAFQKARRSLNFDTEDIETD